jgi:hypothetical protein
MFSATAASTGVLLQLVLLFLAAGSVVINAVRLVRAQPAEPTAGQSSSWSARKLFLSSILELPGAVGLLAVWGAFLLNGSEITQPWSGQGRAGLHLAFALLYTAVWLGTLKASRDMQRTLKSSDPHFWAKLWATLIVRLIIFGAIGFASTAAILGW